MRNLLPEVAKKRIDTIYKIDINFQDMIIIGDTIYDIRCAKYAGAVSVAVGTGWVPADILLKENPDYFFPDLSDFQQFLKLLED